MSAYKDYATKSEFFHDSNKEIQEDIERTNKSKKYIVWVQEFSKKIVASAFLIYLLSSIFSVVMVYISFKQGLGSGIDTLISETNLTFREVVGGYIIKSAIENSVKIGGNYFIGIQDAKLKLLQNNISKDNPDIILNQTETINDEI